MPRGKNPGNNSTINNPAKGPIMAETPEAAVTTPVTEWIIPNQDKFEQVIDARLEKLKGAEKSASSRSRSTGSAAKVETGSAAKADSKEDDKS
jgi:hypothetical protein